jgi:inner membrane protein
MSSLIGHVAVGAALYLGHAGSRAPYPRMALPVLVLLAVLPDFDYFAFWFFGIDTNPRFTHSLAFAMGASLAAWGLLEKLVEPASRLPLAALLMASGSHALLDLLVGVHPVCLLWPLPLPELQFPFGLLPSAGQPRPTNFYFWRNLLIESAVLFPVLACFVAYKRNVPRRTLLMWCACVLPLWLASLAWSVRVHENVF